MDKALQGLKVCYFGHYNPDYSRNRILAKALRRAGAEVITIYDTQKFLLRYGALGIGGLKAHFDVLLVGFPGHTDMPIAKLIAFAKRTPLIFDAFLSLYDSNVQDRGSIRPGSIAAAYYFYVDKIACQMADLILLDTEAHISYFVETFGLKKSKFLRIWAGADDEIMFPRTGRTEKNRFTVFFYGSFIPLHGIEFIVEAARILEMKGETVDFTIVGTGQTYATVKEKAAQAGTKNTRFLGSVGYKHLPILMADSHVCLGIFGNTPKAQRVIPNKVFDALALKKPVITADTPAIRECLTHGKNVWLCPCGNGEAIAHGILTLLHDQALRERIAGNGYAYFREHFSIDRIAEELTSMIKKALGRGNR